jgi:hypothetical protein
MTVEISPNEPVEVTLTGVGAQIWNKWYEQFPSDVRPEVEQEGGVLREQLWHLFHVFGKHISLGREAPFKECAITLVKR